MRTSGSGNKGLNPMSGLGSRGLKQSSLSSVATDEWWVDRALLDEAGGVAHSRCLKEGRGELHLCVCVCISAYMCVSVCACMCVCVCMHACACVCMRVCMRVE